MQKIFFDTRVLDNAVRQQFDLSEDLMMENAAAELENVLAEKKSILILCGGGNNGGDGYALARRLVCKNKKVFAAVCVPEKSPMCCLQKSRAEKCSVDFLTIDEIETFVETEKLDAVVDCIFGSGFHGALPEKISLVVEKINSLNCFKLACDIPSGFDSLGNVDGAFFVADETVTMGAMKLALFSDNAKDACGKITVANLGVSREIFENSFEAANENYFLLEESDCRLPFRKSQNVNKGSFGHAAVVGGEKVGAAMIASSAALRIGAGLVTLVDFHNDHSSGEKIFLNENGLPSETIVPYEIMCSKKFPANTTAIAFGMGLGRETDICDLANYIEENKNIPLVMDADIFYHDEIKLILQKRSDEKLPTILTPHPKEFSVLLEKCGLGSFSTAEVVKNRIDLVKKFCEAFPNIVLLLKGANVIVAQKLNDRTDLFFNTQGCSALAKAGSGDVLAGLIAGLLAQKYSILDAAVTGTLIHGLASKKIEFDFSLTPFELMKKI